MQFPIYNIDANSTVPSFLARQTRRDALVTPFLVEAFNSPFAVQVVQDKLN